MRVLYIIKDYDRLKDEYNEILNSGNGSDIVTPKLGADISNPTEDKAIRLESISTEIYAIEKSLWIIPKEYQHGIKQNVIYGARYPDTAHYQTWQRWRQRWIYTVANLLKYIE